MEQCCLAANWGSPRYPSLPTNSRAACVLTVKYTVKHHLKKTQLINQSHDYHKMRPYSLRWCSGPISINPLCDKCKRVDTRDVFLTVSLILNLKTKAQPVGRLCWHHWRRQHELNSIHFTFSFTFLELDVQYY